MSSQLIQSNAYYGVSSDRYGSNVLLSDGQNDDALSLTNSSFASNNWQIFYQDPIYLIRNYDYGAKFQLGIAEDSPTLPALMIASGNLTQQWNMTLWGDETYKLTNMWLGSVQMLGVAFKSNDNELIPVMTAAQNGSHWSFGINPSDATSNVTDDMLQPVSLQAALSSTSTLSSLSNSASTTVSSTPAEATVTATTVTAGTVSSSSSSVSSQSTTSRSISGGAIAGIVVAIVAAALVVFRLLFFVWRRRLQQRHGLVADQAPLPQQHEQPFYTVMHQVDTRHPPLEIGVSDERQGMRSRAVEMQSIASE